VGGADESEGYGVREEKYRRGKRLAKGKVRAGVG